MTLIIEIPGEPIALQRARASRNRFYDPQFKAKENLAWYVKKQLGDLFAAFQSPLFVKLEFYMPMPLSWSKKKREKLIEQPCMKHTDIDNLSKFIFDALNKIVWYDDSIICRLEATKTYALEGKTIITIKEIS